MMELIELRKLERQDRQTQPRNESDPQTEAREGAATHQEASPLEIGVTVHDQSEDGSPSFRSNLMARWEGERDDQVM
jgi:hypothetical protein